MQLPPPPFYSMLLRTLIYHYILLTSSLLIHSSFGGFSLLCDMSRKTDFPMYPVLYNFIDH